MAEKMLHSTPVGMTRSSSHLPSIYGNDFLELVWENGQIFERGSSSATRMTTSCMGHSINPSQGKEANDEDACIAKTPRFNPLHSLQRGSYLDSSHQSNDKNSCQLDLQFSKTKSSIKLKDGRENFRPSAIGNGYLRIPSTQLCLPSAPLRKPIIESSRTPATNSQKQDLGKVNFSNVLRPSPFLKSAYQRNSATLHTNNTVLASGEQIKPTKVAKAAAAAPDYSAVIDSSKGSHGFTGLKEQTPLISDASKPVSFVARSQESLPDEYSETVGYKSSLHESQSQYYNQTSSSADTNFCNEPLLESSSVCSLGASNNTNLCSRKLEDTDDSTHSSDNDEEPEDVMKEKPAQEGTRTSIKRSRDAEIQNLNERKRRDKISKRLRVLKELIPNCNKMDKASMLDDAIEYLKTLKLQLQIMSMGNELFRPLMMLPPTAHHMMNTPPLPQLMGFRPGTSIPCSLPQFPIPIPPLPTMTDNGVRMFGFPNQVPPMPMSHPPFIPMFGNPSTQPPLPTSTATNVPENLASPQLTTLKVPLPKNSYPTGQDEYSTKQASDQGTK